MGGRAVVGFSGEDAWSAQLIVGKVLIPVSYTIGVPWEEAEMVGRLIGVKTMVNEFVAFQEMQNMTLTVTERWWRFGGAGVRCGLVSAEDEGAGDLRDLRVL